jgi:hypothetical protein
VLQEIPEIALKLMISARTKDIYSPTMPKQYMDKHKQKYSNCLDA